MIKILESTTIRDLDRWTENEVNGVIELTMKTSKDFQPLELISMIHFCLSNIKLNKKLQIKTNLSTDDFREVYKRHFDYYLLLSIILYESNIIIKTKDDGILYLNDILERLKDKLLAQEDLYATDFSADNDEDVMSSKKSLTELRKEFFSSKSKGRNQTGVSFLIPCFDHLISDKLNESYYFYSNGIGKHERGIRPWLERLFSFQGIKILKSNTYVDLSIVLNELMQNTHDWARTSYDNASVVNPNLRASLVNIFLDDRILKEDSGFDHVRFYLKKIFTEGYLNLKIPFKQGKLFEDVSENEKIGLCEISVLDTGPGMARRWLQKDYNEIAAEDELDAVKDCFSKHLTSDTSGRKQLRGRGLCNVVSVIGEVGLIRVRTGHVLLVRDFSEKHLSQNELQNGILDFSLQENKMPRVEGTSISILYPFLYNKNPKP